MKKYFPSFNCRKCCKKVKLESFSLMLLGSLMWLKLAITYCILSEMYRS